MDIIVNVLTKSLIDFTPLNINMLRGVSNNINSVLSYTNGTGQVILPGTSVNLTGISGQTISMIFTNGVTFQGSGSINVVINSTPTNTAINGTAIGVFDSSNITVNVTYNSSPVINDVNLNLNNRGTRNFTIAELENQFMDVDSDSMDAVRVEDNVVGYFYNNGTIGSPNYQPYVASTWILRADIPKLRYTALNQNSAYTKSNIWRARDSFGNTSL